MVVRVSSDPPQAGAPCLACETNSLRVVPPGGTVLGTRAWIADHALPPLLRGHLILKPRRHVASMAELDPAEAAEFGVVVHRLTAAMQAALAPEKLYVFAFGESLDHLHIHVMPRYQGMPPGGGALIERVFAGEWLVGEDDAAVAARLVREALR